MVPAEEQHATPDDGDGDVDECNRTNLFLDVEQCYHGHRRFSCWQVDFDQVAYGT